MDIDNLITMANRIGQFFEAMPDPAEGAKEVATHIRKFWEPRMRQALLAHLDGHDGDGLRPMVKRALLEHRATL